VRTLGNTDPVALGSRELDRFSTASSRLSFRQRICHILSSLQHSPPKKKDRKKKKRKEERMEGRQRKSSWSQPGFCLLDALEPLKLSQIETGNPAESERDEPGNR